MQFLGEEMKIRDVQNEFLVDVAKLILYAKEQGIFITGGELYRTPYQQKHYIKIGRSKTMNSYHLKRLAIDLIVFKRGKPTWICEDYIRLGEYWEKLNSKNKWGGSWRFKDCGHFERHL